MHSLSLASSSLHPGRLYHLTFGPHLSALKAPYYAFSDIYFSSRSPVKQPRVFGIFTLLQKGFFLASS